MRVQQHLELVDRLVLDLVELQKILDAAHGDDLERLGLLAPPRQVMTATRLAVRTELVVERSAGISISLRPLGISSEVRHQRRTAQRLDLVLDVVQQPVARAFSPVPDRRKP